MECDYLFLGDLHLGAGDEREDFLLWNGGDRGPRPAARSAAVAELDTLFTRFLREQLAAARRPVHLVLLGDVVDLWQARRPRERHRDTLLRILTAHPGFVSGLRQWIAAGGSLTWVIGNHDQPLVDPAAWDLLREVLGPINPTFGGRPTHHFADASASLHCEHGHQWDPFNRIVRLTKPDADCFGHRLVRHVVNPIEPHLPLIDKTAHVADLFTLLLLAVERRLVPGADLLLGEVMRTIGRLSRPAAALLHEVEGWIRGRRRPDFARVAAEQQLSISRGLRRAAAGDRRATTAPVQGPLRFLAAGHTHHRCVTALPARRGALPVVHLNPGTWRPVAEHVEGRWQVRQEPGAVSLALRDGAWEADWISALSEPIV